MTRLSTAELLTTIKHGLIVSCQPLEGSPTDKPEIVAAMAQAAILGGAAGVRIEGTDNLAAVRPTINAPIIAIIKRDLADSPVRITPWLQDIDDLAAAGADIIAVDGTDRVRPVSLEAALKRIHATGRLAMADCSNLAEGLRCRDLGFDIIGSTLSGYTGGEVPSEPDYRLVRELKAAGCFVMAEGRYNSPESVKEAMEIGADSVTVGTALTRLELMVNRFAEAMKTA